MAITQILASGTTPAQSTEATLASGTSATLMKRGNGLIEIQIKLSTGSFVTVGVLDDQYPVKQISGPCVYRVNRAATPEEIAVDQDV